MRLLFALLAGCGRIAFDSTDDATTTDGAAVDATPCGAFGAVELEYRFPPNVVIVDTNRIEIIGDEVVVLTSESTGNVLNRFDHELRPIGTPTQFDPDSNAGLAYDPSANRLYGYHTANGDTQVSLNTPTGTLLAGPVATGVSTGAGFVDRAGNLNVPGQGSTNGVHVYDPSLNLVEVWSTLGSGTDADIDRVRNIAWHANAAGIVSTIDLATAGRPIIDSFTAPNSINGITRGGMTLYLLARVVKTIYAYREDGVLLDMLVLVDEATSVVYDPIIDRIVIGYFELSTNRSWLVRVCPLPP